MGLYSHNGVVVIASESRAEFFGGEGSHDPQCGPHSFTKTLQAPAFLCRTVGGLQQ